MSWALLALGAFGLISAINAYVPVERAWRRLLAPSYLLQLYASETVPLQLTLNPLLMALFVYFGALDHWPGWVGLAFDLSAIAFFAAVERRARLSTAKIITQAFGEPLHFELSPLPVFSRLQPLALVHGPWERQVFSYGPARRNTLDVYRPRGAQPNAPVLFFVHGGGWVMGGKRQQGRHMLEYFVRHGWVCVSINYRLSPGVRWPEHLYDCKRALAWVHAHIAEHGGDPSRIVAAGGSAGAQLAATLALSQNQPELQPGFEQGDTSLRACLAFYAPFDLTHLFTVHGGLIGRRLVRLIFGRFEADADRLKAFEHASPMKRVQKGAPPFLVVHGTHDLMVPAEQSQSFAEAMRGVQSKVVHVELPGAIHAFDVFRSWRTGMVAQAAFAFAQEAVSLPTQVGRRS
ncbi:MAG: alpha/beta hydrolase [Myxococcaceae bacterium]